MTPQIVKTLDADNQDFYLWLQHLSVYVSAHYGLPLIPRYEYVAYPGIDSNNPQEVVAFYVFSPLFRTQMYMSQAFEAIFNNDYASVAMIVLNTLANADGKPVPQPLPPPAAFVPPASSPADPVGQPIPIDDGTVQYVDLGSPNIAVGKEFDRTDGSKFIKKGRPMVVGYRTWFERVA